jgi:hypothetical protein
MCREFIDQPAFTTRQNQFAAVRRTAALPQKPSAASAGFTRLDGTDRNSSLMPSFFNFSVSRFRKG